MTSTWWSPGWRPLAVTLALTTVACGSDDNAMGASSRPMMAPRRDDGTIIDDKSLCKDKVEKGSEISETAGPGAIQPNVRRVYRVLGRGPDRRTILVCREVDTNLDGYKDTARFYSDEGQSKKEIADSNFDGKVDTWNLFVKGRLAEEHIDHNHDGEPDEWKIYNGGKLTRVRRDTDFNKKPDVWEMYRRGRLERMGVDLDGDERVDRWDHDTEWRRQLDKAEEAKRDEEERKKKEEAERRAKEATEMAEEDD